MRKFLYILLIIRIISLAIAFFMLLAASPIYSVIVLLLGGLDLIPIIAIISCIDNIEEMQYRQSKLFYKIKKLEEDVNGVSDTDVPLSVNEIPFSSYNDVANATWECVKCSTVNKAGTSVCSNCKAPYSPFINPTDDPFAKKKISRWIKFK